MKELTWRVSTDASLQAVLDDPACPPLLSQVLASIHSWQIRNETTVGRTLQASRLMRQWVAALVALGAVVTVERDGEAVDTALDEFLRRWVKGTVTTLAIPHQSDGWWGEAHVARTPSDDPIVSAFAVVRASNGVVEDARIVLTGVSADPAWLAPSPPDLLGQALDTGRIQRAASAIENEVQPEGDYLGSEEYRRAMAGVLTRRALEACLAQEVGDE